MIELLWLVFDLLLVLMLLTLAWATCETHDVKRGITLFIAFGLLLALAWARLKAPDLALAEAIIGAGISGTLLLSAARDHKTGQQVTRKSGPVIWLISLLTLAVGIVMAWSVWYQLPLSDSVRLSEVVHQKLSLSGVSNPVTAVLLNFRAYDTLLELAVVLTAVLTVLALGTMRTGFKPAGKLLTGMLRWLVPLLMVTSGYLLWVGAHAPGGAFQAGAMLAAAVILIHQGNLSNGRPVNLVMLRWALVSGIGSFTLIGLFSLLLEQSFLAYPQAWSGILILLIETMATISIAAALSLAYLGGRPRGYESQTTQAMVKP